MQKSKPIPIFLLLLSVVYISCQKGDAGPAGAQGVPGTANVMYSEWNALKMNFSTSDSLYEQTITADSLTQAVLDSGIVLTYMKFTDPSTQVISVVSADKYMEEVYSVGKIGLYADNDYTGLYFRYILLHGGIKAGRLASGAAQGYSKEQLKAMRYEDVIKLLGKNSSN